MKKLLIALLAVGLALSAGTQEAAARKVLRVLAIGNSFSEDATEQYLYELAHAQGDSLVIGNAYIGGCSIDRHWQNAQTDKRDYAYRKIIGGHKAEKRPAGLKEIIQDEPWDIITLQQASHFSGQIETYENLGRLRDYVRQTATNPKVRFAFHMTWAYAQDSSHDGFKNYGRSQQQMYDAIRQCVIRSTKAVGIKKVIPSGVAIQQARALVGDTLCRDGFHLSYGMGRYTAACTWCEFLTGRSVVGNAYHPARLGAEAAAKAQQAAHAAMKRKLK